MRSRNSDQANASTFGDGQSMHETDAHASSQLPAAVKPSGIKSSISVFVWIGLSSLSLYAFGAVLARQLGPDQYGLFASVFGIVGLAGLVLGGLQTAVATAVAGLDEADRLASISVGARAVALLGFVVALLLALASPILQSFLRTDSLLLPLTAALIIGILVPWSAVLGVYQGAGSFTLFGRFTFLQAFLRLGALIVLLFTRDVATILFGVALLAVPPTLIAARPHLTQANASLNAAVEWTRGRWEGLLAAFAVALVVGFPTLGDVILARNVLPTTEAGLYAGVALVGRMELFIMIAITSVFYPRFVQASHRDAWIELRSAALLLVALLTGALAIVMAFPNRILDLAVGNEFSGQATELRLYSAFIAIHSLAALVVYFALARRQGRPFLALLAIALSVQLVVPFLVTESGTGLASGYVVGSTVFLLFSLGILFTLPHPKVRPL